MNDTTHTNGRIEQSERQKAILSPVEVDLRDYFAAKAVQGLACSDTTLWPSGADEADDPPDALFMARTAYMIADAMLAARKEKP